MYLTSIRFNRAMEWFLHSKYDYLLLYASGATELDYEISQEVLKYRQLIDAQTGQLVCYLHFIEREDYQGPIIQANHSEPVEDFMLYHINTEEAKNLTKRDLYYGVGLQATYETTEDLCHFFDIMRCDLPAFILINKNENNTELLSLTHQYSLFSIKSTEDLHSLLKPIRIINDYQYDINSIKIKFYEANMIHDAAEIQQQIDFINRGIERLKNETIEDLIQKRNQVIDAIHSILLTYNQNIEFSDKSFYAFKKYLRKVGLTNEFLSQHKDIFNQFKKLDKRIQKRHNVSDNDIQQLTKTLNEKQSILQLSLKKEDAILQLNQKIKHINESYKEKIEETLLVEDASELLAAVNSHSSALPLILEKTIKNYLDKDQLIKSTVNDIREKVQNKMYNVFISCKSEDYKHAEKLFEFLSNKGFHPFIASKSLRSVGSDLYGLVISEVIDSCKHMIVYATNPKYTEAPYVKSEWSRFVNEIYAGRKKGKLLSIIPDPKQDTEMPIDLRARQKFPTNNYEAIVDYLFD